MSTATPEVPAQAETVKAFTPELIAGARAMFETLYGPGTWEPEKPSVEARTFTYGEWLQAFAAGLQALLPLIGDSDEVYRAVRSVSGEFGRASFEDELTAAIRHLTGKAE